MVIVEFPSPTVSVAITLISALVELLLLNAIKNLNAIYECALLKRHRLVRIRSHMRRIRIVNVLVLIFFLALEAIYSTYSSPITTKTQLVEACVSVRPSVQTRFEQHQFWAEARTTVGSCLTVEGDVVSIRIGNYSVDSENMRVSCSKEVYFRFRINDTRELSTADSTLSCVPTEIEDYCVRAKIGENKNNNYNVLWITDEYNKYSIMDEKLPFRRTEVLFPVHEHLDFLARRMARNEDRYSIFLRNNVLLDAVNDSCVFEEEDGVPATSISTPIAIVLVTFWGISLVSFTLTTALNRRRFYSVGNMLDVACKTRRASDDERYPIANASIRMTVENGSPHFVMCDWEGEQQSSEEGGVESPNRVMRDEEVVDLGHES